MTAVNSETVNAANISGVKRIFTPPPF